MSFLAVLSFFCLLVYLSLSTFVLARNPASWLNRVLSAHLACFALWSYGMIFAHDPYTSMASAKLFMNIGSIGWISSASLFLLFALIFTEKEKILEKKWFYAILLVPPMFFIYKQWTNCLIVDFARFPYWAVGMWSRSIWPVLFAFYYVLFIATGLYLFLKYGQRVKKSIKRIQSMIIFSTVTLVLVGASLTDFILPEFKIYAIPPIGEIITLVWAFGLTYAIAKFKFLSITPSIVAGNIISAMADSLFLLDRNGYITSINKAAVALAGYKKKELDGVPMGRLLSSWKSESFKLEDIVGGKIIKDRELILKTKKGEEVLISLSSSSLRDEAGDVAGIVCMARDIRKQRAAERILKKSKEDLKKQADALEKTLEEAEKSRRIMLSMLDDNNQIRERLEEKIIELRDAQDMLVQSEKLASLGRLVSDMAHEVNNPLQIISGRAQLALIELAEGLDKEKKEFEDNLKIVMDQCMRAKDIIQRLLAFSRPSKGEITEVNMNDAIEFVVRLIEHQFALLKVSIARKYDSSLPIIEVDEKQMQEVFMNLLKNAADAMPKDGGTIIITTTTEGDNLRMEFADTGSGIPKEDLKNIFDPFFTTRDQGTGLGLSVCYGIIKAHGGEMKYESEPGKGTIAIILLPLSSK
ncbi:MAG: ATP-binding protein [Candidatus Omnitrophota bacterium]